jgi:hypothetical protein
MKITRCFLAALFFLQANGPQDLITSQNGEQIDAQALRRLSSELTPKFGRLRFHREEELEDRLRPRDSSNPTISIVPHIFRIQDDPADDIVIPRNFPTMYVGVSQAGSSAYKLAGFPDAERNFNEMVTDSLPSRIVTKEQAESRGLLCADLVYGLSPSWWIDGESSVQVKAAQHFFSDGQKNGLALAGRWWKSAKGNRSELAIATLVKGDGFEVELPIFWAPVESRSKPEVRLYRIDVTQRGGCSMVIPPSLVLH